MPVKKKFPPGGRRDRSFWVLTTAVVLMHAWLLGQWHAKNPLPSPLPSAVTLSAATMTAVVPLITPSAKPDVPMPAPTTALPPTPARPTAQPAIEPKRPLALTSIQSSAIASKPSTQAPPHSNGGSAPAEPREPQVNANALAAATAPIAPSVPSPEALPKGDLTGAHSATAPGLLSFPPAAELHYHVRATRKGITLNAHSVLHWQHAAGGYQARLEIKALLAGQRSQTSVGTLDPVHGLQPQRFGDKTRSEQATHFDRTRSPAVLRFSTNTPDQPLQVHSQDRLSVLLQLAAMLAGEPGRFGPGQTVVLHTAGTRDSNMWQFQVGATAPLPLPIGTIEALHLERAPQHAYDSRVDVWLAPSLGHLPVRILWTQANGDIVDQQLASHSAMAVPP